MKNKILLSFFGISILLLLAVFWTNNANADKTENNPAITLKITSDKQSYIQGEVVKLTFSATNETDKPVYVSDVSNGYLKVWIALDGQKFYRYNNTGWGRSEGGGKYVKPKESNISQATVMWNSKPQTSSSVDGNILTDYAFPEAGVYLVKAILTIPSDTLPETSIKIESEPIQITVNAPSGDDLQIWNKIRSNGNIAKFMHRGRSFGFWDKTAVEQNKKIIEEMETLVQNYPNGILAGQLKSQLEKFHTDEKLYLEKRQNQ